MPTKAAPTKRSARSKRPATTKRSASSKRAAPSKRSSAAKRLGRAQRSARSKLSSLSKRLNPAKKSARSKLSSLSKRLGPATTSARSKLSGLRYLLPHSTPPAQVEDPFTLLFHDLEAELKTTRRFLQSVPDGQDDWRPHAKSRTLGELATHVAQLPGFGILMLTQDEYTGGTRLEIRPASSAERVAIFDKVSAELERLIRAMTWDDANSTWTLKFGDRVVASAPRATLLRSAYITHSAHHRAQLGVYFRMLDIPVPGSYGPTADEPRPG